MQSRVVSLGSVSFFFIFISSATGNWFSYFYCFPEIPRKWLIHICIEETFCIKNIVMFIGTYRKDGKQRANHRIHRLHQEVTRHVAWTHFHPFSRISYTHKAHLYCTRLSALNGALERAVFNPLHVLGISASTFQLWLSVYQEGILPPKDMGSVIMSYNLRISVTLDLRKWRHWSECYCRWNIVVLFDSPQTTLF